MTLSILIPTINGREQLLERLLNIIAEQRQWVKMDLEVIIEKDNREKKIGAKRNGLLQKATGDYSVFIDDDDIIPEYYLSEIETAAKKNPDAIGFKGNYSENGIQKKEFIHSITNKEYSETMYYFYRPPNHLNPIKTSIAKQFSFPNKSMFEDTDWAIQIQKSGLLKTEVFIDKIMYNYNYVSNKKY